MNGTVDYETSDSNFVPWNGYSTCSIRFRAVDSAGNVSEWTTTHHIHMDIENPEFTKWWWGTVNSSIAQLYIQATDNIGIEKVQCRTSTATGSYNNWHSFDAVWDSSQNAYRCDITPETFGHYNQTYTTHLYIYDSAKNGGYYNETTANIPSNDTTPPTIASIKAKGYVGGNTITGTLKDDNNLAGYYITSNSSYACGKTAPTSWNSISGTSHSLNAQVTDYGTTYIWVKDATGNTNCTSKTLYLVNPIVSGTNTCQLLSDSYVKEVSNTIKMQINVKCSCGITGTCRNGRNGGTDSDRGYAGVEIKGATSVYYKIWGYSYSSDSQYTGPSWGGKIYQYQTLSSVLPNTELTINSSNNQLLTTNGEGDGVSGYTDWSSSNYMTLSKITANGVSIYNNGFVEY